MYSYSTVHAAANRRVAARRRSVADLGTDQTIPITTLVMRPQVSQGRSRSQPVLNYEVTSVRSFNRRTTAVTVSSALQRTWVSVIIPSLSSFRRRLLQVQSL